MLKKYFTHSLFSLVKYFSTLAEKFRTSTRLSGIIVFLKMPKKDGEFFPTLFVKTTDFQLVFNFEQTRTVTIFGEHGIMAHIPWWLSNQISRIALELSNDSVFNISLK